VTLALPASAFVFPASRAELSAEALAYPFPPSRTGTFYVALGLSVLVHAVMLLIHFEFPDVLSIKDHSTAIEVVLVNSKSAKKPARPDVLAQANLDGGGNTEEDRRAKTNLPALPDMPSEAQLSLEANRAQQLEAEAQRLLAQMKEGSYATDPSTLPVEQREHTDAPKDSDLPDQRLEIARLEAEIAKEWEAYQKLPRRKFIGARTEGVVYAEYVDQWRRKIERVGTANFPDEARRQGTFGSVLVTVAIRADGSVEKVEIDRSSGSRVLDQAVARIVELSGPFPPFPAAVKRETDVLHITRSWAFTRSDLLLSVQ
jgi:protein TonB